MKENVDFECWLRGNFEGEKLLFQEPMSRHTSFRAGGPARYLVQPGSVEEIVKLAAMCREAEIPWFVMGNGSNLLVSDEGYDGLVIKLGSGFSACEIKGKLLRAQAGVRLAKLARLAAEAGLAGLGFAAGIPGSLGGGVAMNAGAYGGELSQVVREALILDREGEIRRMEARELGFGYRASVLQREKLTALEITLALEPGDREEILAQMAMLNSRRKEKQPLEYASAGSTFKRPEGFFAGKLIEDANLAGFSVGDAQVSEKHCGFVVNRGNATAGEIYRLCREIQKRVWEKFQVPLELEVKLLGRF